MTSGDASIDTAIDEARAPFLEPAPVDFPAFVEGVYEHCCDPRGIGVRDGHSSATGYTVR